MTPDTTSPINPQSAVLIGLTQKPESIDHSIYKVTVKAVAPPPKRSLDYLLTQLSMLESAVEITKAQLAQEGLWPTEP